MSRPIFDLGIAALLFGLIAACPTDGLAQKQQKKMQRCFDLEQQFTGLAGERENEPKSGSAIEKGRRGVARCNGGAYMVGARLLEEAIKELGARPVSAD